MEKEMAATILQKGVFCAINPALAFIIITIMATGKASCLVGSHCKISVCLHWFFMLKKYQTTW